MSVEQRSELLSADSTFSPIVNPKPPSAAPALALRRCEGSTYDLSRKMLLRCASAWLPPVVSIVRAGITLTGDGPRSYCAGIETSQRGDRR